MHTITAPSLRPEHLKSTLDQALAVDEYGRHLHPIKSWITPAHTAGHHMYYAAIESTFPTLSGQPGREVFALAVEVHYDGLTLAYEPRPESGLPEHWGCPAEILDYLTPAMDANTRAWRTQVATATMPVAH